MAFLSSTVMKIGILVSRRGVNGRESPKSGRLREEATLRRDHASSSRSMLLSEEGGRTERRYSAEELRRLKVTEQSR